MSRPKLRIAMPERVELSPGVVMRNQELGASFRGTPGSNEMFSFNSEGVVRNSTDRGSGSGSGGTTTPQVYSPEIGLGPVLMTPTSARVLSNSGDYDRKKMVEQFYMSKPRRSSRSGADGYFADADRTHELLDPFLLQDDAKEEELTGLGLGLGQGPSDRSSIVITGMGSGTAVNGGVNGINNNVNGVNGDLLGKIRNGNIYYDLFALNELRNEELISCLLNLDNIVIEEVGKKGVNGNGSGDGQGVGADNLSSFAAASQILETVVMDLHGSSAFKSSLAMQFETLDQIERYLHRLNVNLDQLQQLLRHSRDEVSGNFQKELGVSMSKLNELQEMLSTLDEKLDEAREEVNEQKQLLFQDLSERLEVLDYIGSRFKEQARVTREWRVRQMYIALSTLVLVLAIGVYYIQLRKQT